MDNKEPAKPAPINLDELMNCIVNTIQGMPYIRTAFAEGAEAQLKADKQTIQPVIERLEKCIAEPETTLTLIAQVRLVKEGMLEYICSCGDTFNTWAEFGLHREMIHGDINIGKLKHPGRRYHAAKLLARIAELEARLARSVELTQDEAEILITSFENESMRRYGKVSEQVPVLAKLKARLEVAE